MNSWSLSSDLLSPNQMHDLNKNPKPSISDRRDTFMLDREFMLTQGKTLVTGMPYMYSEGSHFAAVRLCKIWVEDNIIYLDVEELNSSNTFTLSWNLDYCGSYYLWTLADFPTLMNL